jgi:hypothetical protein
MNLNFKVTVSKKEPESEDIGLPNGDSLQQTLTKSRRPNLSIKTKSQLLRESKKKEEEGASSA